MREMFQRKAQRGLITAASHFFKMEAAGGVFLVLAAMIGLLVANSPASGLYNYVLNEVDLVFGFEAHNSMKALHIQKPVLLWINDGLMAVFFFLVGLEIKRELLQGELASRERVLLPALAAIGGMVVPAMIYYVLNMHNPVAISGWAIPAATDIAFALGVLALVGSRAPTSLKILLTAIAIIDDLGAIIIIALFYTENLKLMPLGFALVALLGLAALNKGKVAKTAPYVLLGFLLWFAVLKSGVHATLAGVITALFIPLRCPKNPSYSPLKHVEHSLHPWVAFMVLPVFAFANAGISFDGIGMNDVLNPVTLGIAAGLFIGKQIGVFSLLWLTIVTGLSPKPKDANWVQLYAVSLLCGVGFTMSLFIGGLAFETDELSAYVRLGVIIGSLLSATLAFILLKYGPTSKKGY